MSTPEISRTEDEATVIGQIQQLVTTGQFKDAHDRLETLQETDPENRKIAMWLAAIKSWTGNPEAGRNVMQDLFRRVPVLLGDEGRPSVLTVRGMEHTDISLTKTARGAVVPSLVGGHFTLGTLLPRDVMPRHVLTLVPDHKMSFDQLPDVDLVLNTIAEPDVEPTTLAMLDTLLEERPDLPVINRPDAVRETTRDGNCARLKGIDGLIFPGTARIRLDQATPEVLYKALDATGLPAPLILRPVGTQTGRGVELIQQRGDIERAAATPLTGEYYVIAFRKLLWRGTHYRKMRLYCIDGSYYPFACFLDVQWAVHGSRKKIMADFPVLMEEEKRYLRDWRSYVGAKAIKALEEVARRTPMDFFGIDFTLDDDGNVFIYELNAAMRHNYDHQIRFPYKKDNDYAITEAFQAMVRSKLPQPDLEG